MFGIEADHDVDSFPVEKSRYKACGNGVIALANGIFVIVSNWLPVDSNPGVVFRSKQITAVVKVEDVIKAKIDISVSVVIEEIIIQAFNQSPLLIRQGDDLFPVCVCVPNEISGVETVFCDIACGLLLADRPAEEEIRIGGRIAWNR